MFKNIVVAMTANTAGLKAGMASATRDVRGFDAATKQANVSGKTLGKTLGKAGVAAAALALAGGLAASVSQAKDFDSSMRNVNSIAKESEAQFASTSAAVLEISTRLPQSATVLADGLYDIASSGFQGAEGLMVLEASATAAAAGLTETSVSAKAITAVLNAYGRGAEDAEDVSDVLFKTVDVGVVSFEELAGSLGNVVGLASAAEVPIEEVGAAMAAMTLAGIGAAESSTSLTRLIQGLIDPSDELAAHMQSLGYESGQVMLDTLGLHGAMEELRTTTDGSVESWLALFPEIRAARGAFALTAAEGQNYANTAEAIIDANSRAGATQIALNEQLKSLSMQWDLFKSSASAVAITVGTQLLPVIIDTVTWVQEAAKAIGQTLTPFVEDLWPSFESLADAGGSLVGILAQIVSIAGPIAAALAGIVATAAIEGFVLLADATAAFLGWVEESNVVVPILATILAVSLAPKLALVVSNMTILAGLHIAQIWGGITGAVRGAAAAFATLSVSMGAIGIIAGAAVAAVMAIKNIRDEARETADQLEETFGRAIDTSTSQGQLDQLQMKLNGMRTELESMGEVTDIAGFDELGRRFKESLPWVENTIRANKELQTALGDNITELEERARNADAILHEVSMSIMDTLGAVDPAVILEVADALGIDLTTAARDEAVPALIEMVEAAAEGEGAAADLVTEFDSVAGATARMAEELNEYTDSLRAAFDPLFAAQKASIDLADAHAESEAALKKLNEAIKEHGPNSEEAAEAQREFKDASRANVEAAVDQESALNDLWQAVQSGETDMDTAREAVERWRNSNLVLSESAEIVLSDIEALLEEADEWGNTNAEATIDADRNPAYEALDGATQRAIDWEDSLYESTVDADEEPAQRSINDAESEAAIWGRSVYEAELRADASQAKRALTDLTLRVQSWSGRTFTANFGATGDGPGRRGGGGGNATATVRAAMQGIPGLRITSTYRTPAHNRRVGGSPSSYHLDRSNPATDVGGPNASLDRLYARLRGTSFRELIWRAPGHWDHLHYAHQGGEVEPSWPTDPRLRADERPAVLQVGEEILDREMAKQFRQLNLLPRFHDGGAVGDGYNVEALRSITRGPSGGTALQHLRSIERLREAYEEMTREIERQEQAARRLELVEAKRAAETKEDVQAATEALKDFDREATLASQRRVIEARIEQAETNQRINANREEYEFGLMSSREQIAWLTRQMDAHQRYTDEWVRLSEQRQSILKSEADAAERAFDDAFAELNRMLDERDRITQQLDDREKTYLRDVADEHEAYADAVKAAQQRATDAVKQAVESRRQQLMADLSIDFADDDFNWQASTIADQIDRQVEQLSRWRERLAEAQARGLSGDAIASLGLDRGPEALGQLEVLLRSSDEELARLNLSVAERLKAVNETVNREQKDANSQLSSDIRDIHDELGADLRELHETHTERLNELTEAFRDDQAALREELAEVGKDNGRTYSEAIAEGIASGIPAIRKQVNKVRSLMGELQTARVASKSDAEKVRDLRASLGLAPDAVSDRIWEERLASGQADMAEVTRRLMLKAGFKTYDVGGTLPPGLTMAYNKTGRDEYVMTGAQLADVIRGGSVGGASINVIVQGNLDNVTLDQVTRVIERANERRESRQMRDLAHVAGAS